MGVGTEPPRAQPLSRPSTDARSGPPAPPTHKPWSACGAVCQSTWVERVGRHIKTTVFSRWRTHLNSTRRLQRQGRVRAEGRRQAPRLFHATRVRVRHAALLAPRRHVNAAGLQA